MIFSNNIVNNFDKIVNNFLKKYYNYAYLFKIYS